MAAANLTAERVRELLHYDPETGIFTWRKRRGSMRAGAVAGYIQRFGYTQVHLDRNALLAHRLAWLHFYGRWPERDIDHIDGDRSNNRINNLRDVTDTINLQNRRTCDSDNQSGYLGVSRKATTGRFGADIQVHGKKLHIGYFDTPEAAHAAYLDAKRRLHAGCMI